MDDNEDRVDPRIKDALDCLNATSEKINYLENEINTKRDQHQTALSEATHTLNHLSRKLGDCIGKARPYYEARRKAKEALQDTQQSALNFERAVSMHAAAREMVSVAEQAMGKDGRPQDTAWAEMLNNATVKVNEAEIEKYSSEAEHRRRAELFKDAEKKVSRLEKKLKSNIQKSRPYFEVKQQIQKSLEELSSAVRMVETQLQDAKTLYSRTLCNLEEISDEIHASRSALREHQQQHILMLGKREDGVGAEAIPVNEIDRCKREDEFSDHGSFLSVLSDLKKDDSTEHLSQVFQSVTLDNLSYSSEGSFASSNSNAFTKETQSSLTVTSSCSSKTSEEQDTLVDITKTEAAILARTDSDLARTSFLESIPNEEKLFNNLASNQTGSPIKLASKSIKSEKRIVAKSPQVKPRSDEILLSIAGLGEVSTM